MDKKLLTISGVYRPFLAARTFDDSVWTKENMSVHDISDKLASEMGNLDQSSKGGMKEILSNLEKPRKILLHINNTNPNLDKESDERKELDKLGTQVSYYGMDIHI